MRIEGSARPAAVAGKSSARRSAAGFAVAETADAPPPEAASAPEAAAPPGLIGGLPPAAQDPADDREAAVHGAALLDAMAGLQQALIGGDPETARARLADLAQSPLSAADPRLDSVLKAVAQRAAVELARRQ